MLNQVTFKIKFQKTFIAALVLIISFALSSLSQAAETAEAQAKVETTTAAQVLNINKANLEQLASLPGIGPSKAEAILTSREDQGQFTSLDDLQRVKGIGAKTAERLAPLISF